jgi:hypothetical protein
MHPAEEQPFPSQLIGGKIGDGVVSVVGGQAAQPEEAIVKSILEIVGDGMEIDQAIIADGAGT